MKTRKWKHKLPATDVFCCYLLPVCLPAQMLPQAKNYEEKREIKLLESPIPAAPAAPPSQKAPSDDISGTKRGTIDPLVSKRPEKNSE